MSDREPRYFLRFSLTHTLTHSHSLTVTHSPTVTHSHSPTVTHSHSLCCCVVRCLPFLHCSTTVGIDGSTAASVVLLCCSSWSRPHIGIRSRDTPHHCNLLLSVFLRTDHYKCTGLGNWIAVLYYMLIFSTKTRRDERHRANSGTRRSTGQQ